MSHRSAHRSLARAAVAAVLLITSASAIVLVTPPAADAVTYSVKGVDVASWQHPSSKSITWSKVKGAGYSFAIIKATESTTYTNPWFAGDRSGAAGAGLVVGAYHFARPAMPISTATAQARYFASVIGSQRLSRTLPPILDIESTGGLSKTNLAKWMNQFLVTVRTATGRTPMIYSYDSFLRNSVANVSQFSGYPLWYANYTTTLTKAMPGAWPSWRIWQHSSSGKVSGISGTVDLNRFNGSYANLLSFANGTVPASVHQSEVQPWERAYITGKVGAEFAGEKIVRQSRSKNGPWHTDASSKVTASGTFSLSVRPVARGLHYYRAYLLSGSPYAHMPSKTLTVKVVKPGIHVSISKTKIKKGKTVHITGRVDTFYAGEKVLRQKRSASGKWKTVSTHHVGSNGRFDFAMKPTSRTTHKFRVLLRATGPTAKATSRTLTLRVT